MHRSVRIVICVVACLGAAILATIGSRVFPEFELSSGPYFERCEHGWPWPFLHRLEFRESNRFNLFSGDHEWDVGYALLDGIVFVGIVGTVIFYTLRAGRRPLQFTIRSLLLLTLFASLLLAHVEWITARCRSESALESRLRQWGCLTMYSDVGPVWLRRIVGYGSPRMRGITEVYLTDASIVGHSHEAASTLRQLKYVREIGVGRGKKIPIDAYLEKTLQKLPAE